MAIPPNATIPSSVGRGASTEGKPIVVTRAAEGNYLAVPSADQPRLLVPRRSTSRWGYHRLEPRTSLKSVAFGLALSFPELLGEPVDVAGADELTSLTSDSLGWPVRLAFRPGTQGAYTKLGMFALREDGEMVAFGKAATEPLAINQVLREAAALEELRAQPNLRPRVPRVLALTSHGSTTLLLLSAAPARPGPRRWGYQHHEFMEVLHRGATWIGGLGESKLWSNAIDTFTYLEPRLAGPWPRRLEIAMDNLSNFKAAATPLGHAHRDLAPWNTRLADDGALFVFDWEFWQHGYPHSFDALHFAASLAARDYRQRSGAAWRSRVSQAGVACSLAYVIDMCLLYLRARHEAPARGNTLFLDWLGAELDLLCGTIR